jgi:hypothetical protein
MRVIIVIIIEIIKTIGNSYINFFIKNEKKKYIN